MKIGVQVRATDETVDLDWIAWELEQAGIESLWLPEHTHVPVQSASVHPGGSELMHAAKHGIDPFIGLAIVAAVTRKLRLGTGVCLLAQHDPIVLAKVISTLDHISKGRVLLGIGAGWAREEMANHGVDPRRRFDVMREKALALRSLWSEPESSFHGEFVNFDPVMQWPKPAQPGGVPILVGGEGRGVLDRVLDYGDGWIPNWNDATLSRVAELRRIAKERGRPEPSVTVYAAPWKRDVVDACAAAGVERVCFDLEATREDEVKAGLKQIRALMA